MWWSRQPSTTLSEFPPGTFLKTEKGYFYVISPTRRRKFTTRRVLKSWSPQRIVKASEDDPAVQKAKVSSKMKFRNGSLLRCFSSGKIYLISDHMARHITNPDILAGLGAKRQDATWVSLAEINLHEEGRPLD